MATIKTGLDKLASNDFEQLKGAKLGVIANIASVDSKLRHIVDRMHASSNCNLIRLFGPEHGIRGAYQAMEEVTGSTDPHTDLPVISLYGNSEKSLTPTADVMEDLDILVVDLHDIGSRYYTYAQTLCYAMRTATETGTKVVVLDRPNPINGSTIEGATLTKDNTSFCGEYPIANRHGLTIGELAILMNKGFGTKDFSLAPIQCELEVVSMDGWSRKKYLDDTDYTWVSPSPNMSSLDTAIVYPGACLFEATNLSEGRGTTQPFEILGAPFIDGKEWANATLNLNIALEGCILRPMSFIPQFDKFANKLCGGLQIHVTDRHTFKPFRLALALIATAAKIYPELFSWRQGSYEFIENVQAIDLLYGSYQFRKCVETKGDLSKIFEEMELFEKWFAQARSEFLLY